MNSENGEKTDHDTENEDIPPIALEAPGKNKRMPAAPIKLIFEIIMLLLAIIPMSIWSIIQFCLVRRKSVAGKVVLVTGAGRGLGRGFVDEFAKLGCKVACVDIDPNTIQETVKLVNEKYTGCAKAYICNISLPDDIKALKEAVINDFGQVDILVHNAGIVGGSAMCDFEDAYMYNVININLTSHFVILREFLPDMIKRNDGHYVALGSMASFNSIKGASLYCATKHGVLGLMNCLQRDLESNPNNQVKASLICPYFVNTSALYNRHWSIRLPELSIKFTVKNAVDGILKNRKTITIPGNLYYVSYFLKFMPDCYVSLFFKVFYAKVTMPSTNEQVKSPLYQHLKKSLQKANQSANN